KLYVFGIVDAKLAFFSFADEVYRSDSIPPDLRVDHAFECVGGAASADAINSIIDMIRPQGTVMLMGVSEKPVAINTRMVLERGLTLIGRSRSTTDDFIAVRDLLESRPVLQDKLCKIIRTVLEIRTIKDMQDAFDEDFVSPFKTVLHWNV
ncbi:MAG: zinc-binding dehydrogenase, partial [Clostridia bacterium]|nr:zinc-binding dehydrogenase [Clostridia bacterium]